MDARKRTISSIIKSIPSCMIYIGWIRITARSTTTTAAPTPLLVDDVVRSRRIVEGAPAWVAQEDGLLSAAHDSRTMNHQIWKVESDRTAGAAVDGRLRCYFLGEGAEGPAYIDAPPPQGRGIAPLCAVEGRGTGEFVLHKGEGAPAGASRRGVLRRDAVPADARAGPSRTRTRAASSRGGSIRDDWQKVPPAGREAEAGHGRGSDVLHGLVFTLACSCALCEGAGIRRCYGAGTGPGLLVSYRR